MLQESTPRSNKSKLNSGLIITFGFMRAKDQKSPHTFCLRARVSLGIRASALPMTGMILTFSCTARRKATSRGRSLHPGIGQGLVSRYRDTPQTLPKFSNPQGAPQTPCQRVR